MITVTGIGFLSASKVAYTLKCTNEIYFLNYGSGGVKGGKKGEKSNEMPDVQIIDSRPNERKHRQGMNRYNFVHLKVTLIFNNTFVSDMSMNSRLSI